MNLSATRIPPGPDYTGGGGFSLPIDLTIYLCLIEFLVRPNQSHAHKRKVQEKSTKAKTSCKNSIDLRNSERGNPPGKSIQNRRKMLRWRCLGDAWGLPGASLGRPRDQPGPISAGDRKFIEKWAPSATLPGRPESSPGTQKSTKNCYRANTRRSKSEFFDNVCAQNRFS